MRLHFYPHILSNKKLLITLSTGFGVSFAKREFWIINYLHGYGGRCLNSEGFSCSEIKYRRKKYLVHHARLRSNIQQLHNVLYNWIQCNDGLESLIKKQLLWHDNNILTLPAPSAVSLMLSNHCLSLCIEIDIAMRRRSAAVYLSNHPCLRAPIDTWIYEPACYIFFTLTSRLEGTLIGEIYPSD